MPVSSFTTRFSDSKIVMTDFGAEGMPKIVLVGGSKHSILYSSEFSVDATKLEQAIVDQLSTLNDVQDNYSTSLSVQPQPADQVTRIALEESSIQPEQCQLVDAFGRVIAASAYIQLNADNSLDLDCRTLASGNYTLVLPTSKGVRHASIIVHH